MVAQVDKEGTELTPPTSRRLKTRIARNPGQKTEQLSGIEDIHNFDAQQSRADRSSQPKSLPEVFWRKTDEPWTPATPSIMYAIALHTNDDWVEPLGRTRYQDTTIPRDVIQSSWNRAVQRFGKAGTKAQTVRALTDALYKELVEADIDMKTFDSKRLARAMMRLVPLRSSTLADRVGPFYDTAAMSEWLGITRQALDKKVKTGKLIGLMTSDRKRFYPEWQFTAEGELIPYLPEVLAELRNGTSDEWMIALWMRSPKEALKDESAAEWLVKRNDPEAVLELARHDAAAWAS
ncbi:hypothetical protein LJ753_09990 [Arthrobacter sp. zg-Y20]|uniref:hypothetical protein n=1 Tax=unclassified Arthrobacter TaxID=235627 RepID=UPI001D13B49E|nr:MULTISPECIES: hypothetical protein [unclassified Arthrobacter]MCC3276199.1 hypothetical protein [Arthrobacter sp. zg-Y20]MDK1316359.1 hypothetical protein [Arthrobacter sp. zg.Y20]WIB06407.1 hypothetical protein QNO06_01300 [Arthrobacter sp. zg-Y20]